VYFDRFDIVQAYYLFFINYHEGLWSEKYARLCKMQTYFKPGLNPSDLTENGWEIYRRLEAKQTEPLRCQ